MAESFKLGSKAPDNSNPSTAVEPKSESNGASFVFEAATTEQKPSSFDQSSPQQQKSSADAPDSNPFAAIQLKPESNGASFVFEAPTTVQKPFSFDQSSPQQQKSSADASDSNPFTAVEQKSESNGASFVFEAPTTEQKPSIEDINTNFFKAIQDNWKDGNVAADLSSFMAQYIHMAENDDGGDGDSEDENGNNSAGQFSA